MDGMGFLSMPGALAAARGAAPDVMGGGAMTLGAAPGMMGGGAMTPQEIRAYLQYVSNPAVSSFAEQNKSFEDQLAEANALRNPGAEHHITGLGAALGGLGDIVNIAAGSRAQNRARGNQKLLQLAKAAALKKFGLAAPEYDEQRRQMQDPIAGPGAMTDPSGGGGAYIMPR